MYKYKIKVKLSLYRPEQALGAPGGWGSRRLGLQEVGALGGWGSQNF
jgi:hypothetical protein